METMNTRHVITCCAWNRPAYTAPMLAHLGACEGIGAYRLLAFIEPGCPAVADLFAAVDFCECQVTHNSERLGVNHNMYQALAAGFAVSDYVIHVEDDVLLAPDALVYFEHCRQVYAADPTVYTVTAYHQTVSLPEPSDWHSLIREAWFSPWGWATWRDRWLEAPRGLCHTWVPEAYQFWWDSWVHKLLRRSRDQVAPLLSRAQNIGAAGGAHVPSADWHARRQHIRYWAGDYTVPAGMFGEATAKEAV